LKQRCVHWFDGLSLELEKDVCTNTVLTHPQLGAASIYIQQFI